MSTLFGIMDMVFTDHVLRIVFGKNADKSIATVAFTIMPQISLCFYRKHNCPKGKHNCSENEQLENHGSGKSARRPHIDTTCGLTPFGIEIAI